MTWLRYSPHSPIVAKDIRPCDEGGQYCKMPGPAKEYRLGAIWRCDKCNRRWKVAVVGEYAGVVIWVRRYLPWPK
jgi:hypothetical protein